MMIACVALYVMSVCHLVATVYDLLGSVSSLINVGVGGVGCADAILSGASCPEDFSETSMDWFDQPLHTCLPTIPLLISVSTEISHQRHPLTPRQIIVGDTIVLWRALVVWQRNRAVQVISAGLILSTFGGSIKIKSRNAFNYHRYIRGKPFSDM